MTEKVLSQDEVDALLKGVASGEIDTEEAKDKILAGVRPYDFTSQERIIRGKMPGLEMINDSFSRALRNSISTFIMKYTDVNIQSVDTVKYSDFMKTIPMPSSINLFTMDPLKGYALLVLEAPLVFAFIEFFFGGSSAQHVKSEGRAFTLIEQRVIQKIVNIALGDMTTAWNAIAPIKPEYVGSEINPQFVSIVTPAEIVIKIEIYIEIEDFAGKMFICIPYSMVEPIKEKLYSGMHGDKFETDYRWTEVMKEALKEARLNLSVDLGRLAISFKDLLNFEVGNVINLAQSVSDELTVNVEGIEKFKCIAGCRRGNQAIKLTGFIE
ncbi:MAG TPA: flagellar motor switch protein FliM [Nitrospirae bacterium]|nr:flagellar motor switch protein FliM [Nitrospirota bacterium]